MHRNLPPALLLNGQGYTVFNWKPSRINEKTHKLEMHVPFANYEGPGTDIERRLREHIPPTSNTDAAAKQHDIAYHNIGVKLMKGQITREEAEKLIRNADKKITSAALKNTLSLNPVEKLHAVVGATGIIAKMAGEEAGVMDPLMFSKVEKQATELATGEGKRGRKKAKQNINASLRKRLESLK